VQNTHLRPVNIGRYIPRGWIFSIIRLNVNYNIIDVMDISSCNDNLTSQLENLESYGPWKSSAVKSFDTSMVNYTQQSADFSYINSWSWSYILFPSGLGTHSENTLCNKPLYRLYYALLEIIADNNYYSLDNNGPCFSK
jgi:hypothetical protein